MKIMWLCYNPLSDLDSGKTGTWLDAMARGLLDSGVIELGIIAFGPVKRFTRNDYYNVRQWIVPRETPLGTDGMPAKSLVQDILAAAEEFAPDLIQVWGVETFFGLLPVRGLLKYPSLLEMQGLQGQYAKVFWGGLTWPERLCCVGIKEVLKRRTMGARQRDFAHWKQYEEEIIAGHRFIGVQSAWINAHVKAINHHARLFSIDPVLRKPFYETNGWQMSSGRRTLFCSAASSFPYKGLHVAIRALALLRKRIPDVRMNIAGAHQRGGIREDGYIRWINWMIRKMDLTDAINWLGPLTAEEIVEELKNSSAMVIPTFIENYCTAMQEAMIVGTPVVVSYVGGIPSLGKEEESCLFFTPGDEIMCADQLERLLTNQELSKRISHESRKIALLRNNRQRLIQCQLEIYRQVLEETDIKAKQGK